MFFPRHALKLRRVDRIASPASRCAISLRTPRHSYSTPAIDTLDYTKLQIEKTTQPRQKSPKEKLIFGKEFTDHMFEVDWERGKGWGTPKISPYHKLELDPSCTVFHYAVECFEGMKAYKDKEGGVRLFRPDKNYERLKNSCHRLTLPGIDYKGFSECLKALLLLDKDWIPEGFGYSLYIRPTVIGTQPSLGVGPSSYAKFFTILSPVGPYYPTGWKPVKLLADPQFVRAWPGGTGNAKVGVNYAPGIYPQVMASEKGYSQILWLFGEDDQVTEVGTMNMFLLWINENGEKELVTAPLDGTVLPGVTRDSIIRLAKQWGEFKVSERKYTMPQVVKALEEGRVIESFGAGTAAVVSPIETINYKGKDYKLPLDKENPNAQIGVLTKRFADTIMGIQYGEIESEWSVKL